MDAATVALPSLSPLTLQMRRVSGSVVGRTTELTAIQQELAAARTGQLAAVTLEGEPGIGKTRLLVATSGLAETQEFLPVAVTADEEISGPFLLARGLFSSLCAHEEAKPAQEELQKTLAGLSGADDPGLTSCAPTPTFQSS